MRKMLVAFALLFLCPEAVAGADEYEEHANEASPAEGPPADPGAPGHSGTSDSATTSQDMQSSTVLPPPCKPDC